VGAVVGIAFGLKLTAGIFAVGVAVALLVVLLASSRRLRPLFIFFVFLGIGFVASYGFWGYNLYHEYQNPVFPQMNGFFRSPYYDLRNIADSRFLPTTWQQTFFYPFFFAHRNHRVSEIVFRDGRLAVCYIAFVALLIAGIWRWIARMRDAGQGYMPTWQSRSLIFLTLFFAISYVLWEYQFSIYRYLVVLELLAPVFLALVLASFFKSKTCVFALSLIIEAVVCFNMISPNFGRQKFDDAYLKVDVPKMAGLEQSVVLMGGDEATSYIIPSFPAATRFVRISSNFLRPGQNSNLDQKIRSILAKYGVDRTYVYLAGESEKERVSRDARFYGVNLDDESCRPLRSSNAESGLFCATSVTPRPKREAAPVPESFVEKAGVRLEITPKAPVQNSWIKFHVIGLNLHSRDVLYTIEGERQPPQTRWILDKQQSIRFPVTPATPKGMYHVIGIRDSAAPAPNPWIRVDASVRIR